jgi:hypothetical protein
MPSSTGDGDEAAIGFQMLAKRLPMLVILSATYAIKERCGPLCGRVPVPVCCGHHSPSEAR